MESREFSFHCIIDLLPTIKRYAGYRSWRNFIIALQSDKSFKHRVPRLRHLIALEPQILRDFTINRRHIRKITFICDKRLKLKNPSPLSCEIDLRHFKHCRDLILIGNNVDYSAVVQSCRVEKILRLTLIADRSLKLEVKKLIAAFPSLQEFYLYNYESACIEAAKVLVKRKIPYAALLAHPYRNIKARIIEDGKEAAIPLCKRDIIKFADLNFCFNKKYNDRILTRMTGLSKQFNKTPPSIDNLYADGVRDFYLHDVRNVFIPAAFAYTNRLGLYNSADALSSSVYIHFPPMTECWSNITELYLYNVKIKGGIPRMPQLEMLSLFYIEHEDGFYETLAESPVKELHTTIGNIESGILEYFCNIERLIISNMYEININAEHFCELNSLKELIFHGAKIIGGLKKYDIDAAIRFYDSFPAFTDGGKLSNLYKKHFRFMQKYDLRSGKYVFGNEVRVFLSSFLTSANEFRA